MEEEERFLFWLLSWWFDIRGVFCMHKRAHSPKKKRSGCAEDARLK